MTELASAGFVDATEVGRGVGTVVYRCYHSSLRCQVAVKVLASAVEVNGRERFLRAGDAMGRLSGHPNVMNIVQLGVTEGNRPYITMQYCPAGSLGLRLRRTGPVPWPEALRIGVKLCGALETAHQAGTLHCDVKPENVLVTDRGEPQLADFGIAHAAGGDKTATGLFTDAIAYTAPEVLAGDAPTVAADIYSLGATLYALIAGSAARSSGEDLIAHYLRLSSAPVPNMRPRGIPGDVCAAIERAMSVDPGNRQASAAEFGQELQVAQHRHGTIGDLMEFGASGAVGDSVAMPPILETEPAVLEPAVPEPELEIQDEEPAVAEADQAVSTGVSMETATSTDEWVEAIAQTRGSDRSGISDVPVNVVSPTSRPIERRAPPVPISLPEPSTPRVSTLTLPSAASLLSRKGKRRNPMLVGAFVAALLLVLGGVVVTSLPQVSRDSGNENDLATEPTTALTTAERAVWQPITSARLARTAAAATRVDGTISIFGGITAEGVVSGQNEGYEARIDGWNSSQDLPIPVLHAAAATWQGTAVVLGGWQSSPGTTRKIATDRVWRMVNDRWEELPRMFQPRAAGAAAVVGDRIIVTGGVDANGALLSTTEIFDGSTWTLGAELPTPRLLLAAASDDKLVYAVGGINDQSDSKSVEAYDPVANIWTGLPDLPQARSDLGVAIADGRLLAVGGTSAGQVLKSVAALDLPTFIWTALPDMGTARHGMAVAAVADSVYAIGGSTEMDDRAATSSAEALKLPARNTRPA